MSTLISFISRLLFAIHLWMHVREIKHQSDDNKYKVYFYAAAFNTKLQTSNEY